MPSELLNNRNVSWLWRFLRHATQSYYMQLNTCVVESILLGGDRKTKESGQLLHWVQCFQRTWFIYISAWLNREAVFPGQLLKMPDQDTLGSPPLLLCLGDQYVRDHLHKNTTLSIGDWKLLRVVNRISNKLLWRGSFLPWRFVSILVLHCVALLR